MNIKKIQEIKDEFKKIYNQDLKMTNNTLFELHIKSYNDKNFELGKKVGCLIIENNLWKNVYQVQKNQLFYLENLSKLENSEIYTLTEPFLQLENPKPQFKDKKYNVLNPSIYKDIDNNIYVNIRHVSFIGHNYESMTIDHKIRTRNTFGLLENNKLSSNYYELKDRGYYTKLRNSGF